jgi:ABC-type Fe3+-hydroxamate transport system substrate-binding protein
MRAVMPPGGKRARVVLVLLCAVLAGCASRKEPGGAARIVSLSPAITETLFAIGAGDAVVGVTDYCDFPPEARGRRRAGTMLTPNYEVIAGLRPTLIVGEAVKHSPHERLSAIAPTRVLPWLTLQEVLDSTTALGELTGRSSQAGQLVARLRERLGRSPPPNAPRVLLALVEAPGPLSEVWYVKRRSLHGTALEASGGRNAVEEDVSGAPVLPLERLIALDPEIIVVLTATEVDGPTRERLIAAWQAFPMLAAVKRGAVRVIAGPAVQSMGPRILDFADALEAILREARRTP